MYLYLRNDDLKQIRDERRTRGVMEGKYGGAVVIEGEGEGGQIRMSIRLV